MNTLQRAVFGSFVSALRLYRRLFLDLHVQGAQSIPAGPKIFVTNHITSTDPYWVLPVFREPVHIIIGPGYQSRVVGWVYDRLEQINALPRHRTTVIDHAIRYLERGESIYTAPEGDLHPPGQLGRFYPGVGRIYRRTLCPFIPIALLTPRSAMKAFPSLDMNVEGRIYRTVVVLRGPFFINVGAPFRPSVRDDLDEDRDAERICGELRDRMELLIGEIREAFPSVPW